MVEGDGLVMYSSCQDTIPWVEEREGKEEVATFKEDLTEMGVSWHEGPQGGPSVIGADGGDSSPKASKGTGRAKSKSSM